MRTQRVRGRRRLSELRGPGLRSPSFRNLEQQALWQARLDRLRSELGPGLSFDDRAAIAVGSLAALVAASGRNQRRQAIDLMIAATAYVHDAGVLTRDGEDLVGIESLVAIATP